jgi:hypothetical protein
MPTRKQRRRTLKGKRHEYETVWVDGEGNVLEEAPPEAEKPAKPAKAAPAKQPARQTGGRRQPSPPSWSRAAKRAAMLGVVVFVLFSFTAKGSNKYLAAAVPAVIYTALFVPFTYAIDRYAYKRYLAKQAAAPATKKR